MTEIGVRLFLFLLCLAGGAFFAGMETGIVSINRLRLRHLVQRRVPEAMVLDEFVRKPDLFLGTTLVGTNFCYVVAAIMVATLTARIHPVWGPLVGSILVSLLILVFSEYLPKAWFQSAPARRTMPMARALRFFSRVFLPASWLITRLVRFLLPKRESRTDEERPMVSREELIHLTDEGRRTGSLTPVESRMIRNVFEVGCRRVGEIMIPRNQIVSVERTQTPADVLVLARSRDMKRFPVWDDAKKSFAGIVNVFDILLDPEGETRSLADFIRPAQTVTVRETVEHIMPRMRVSRQPMTLVVDERFDVVGLVTIEDVLREVVGA